MDGPVSATGLASWRLFWVFRGTALGHEKGMPDRINRGGHAEFGLGTALASAFSNYAHGTGTLCNGAILQYLIGSLLHLGGQEVTLKLQMR